MIDEVYLPQKAMKRLKYLRIAYHESPTRMEKWFWLGRAIDLIEGCNHRLCGDGRAVDLAQLALGAPTWKAT